MVNRELAFFVGLGHKILPYLNLIKLPNGGFQKRQRDISFMEYVIVVLINIRSIKLSKS
jgi:hypothetical protein